MAEILDLIMSSPATWGVAGSFIYAGPRWLACAFASKGAAWRCSLEAAICLLVGAIAAQAFGQWVLAFLHQRPADLNAIAAMIGLLANPLAPKLTEGLAGTIANTISSRVGKLTKGDDK